jgi:predicted phosphoribosyltransferase
MTFKNRTEAGNKLADLLEKYADQEAIVYGLPRGGVAVAAEIAKRLKAPLDLIIARKVGHPYNPEYGICAVTESDQRVCNEEEVAALDQDWLAKAIEKECREAQRRRVVYLANRKPLSVAKKVAILVDDGLATGLTMQASIKEVKQRNPDKVVVAVPVAPAETIAKLQPEVDEILVLYPVSGFFGAIGSFYDHFPQLRDEDVVKLLK